MRKDATSPKVAIIIVSWNSWAHLEQCLPSLEQLTYPNVEIVVVDNASADGSADRVAAFRPGVTLVRNTENLGSAGGNNVGMRYALSHGADYVWLLNADAEPAPDSLARLVAAAEADPVAGIVAPVLYDFHDRETIQNCGALVDWEQYRIRQLTDLDLLPTADPARYWVWATAVLISRRALETAGLYDERYFVYCDDMDLSMRANRAGFVNRTVVGAKVYHKSHYSGTIQKLPLHYYFYITRNEYFYWTRFLPRARRAGFVRRYLARTLAVIGEQQRQGRTDVVDVCCDSLYWALTGRAGAWDKTVKMPARLKNFIVRHRHGLGELLELHVGRLARGGLGKVMRRLRIR
jgi:GT2 family glycosyltransferase